LKEEIEALEKEVITPNMFIENYKRISKGTEKWNSLVVK
jgi:hypothetical protein